MRGFAVRGLALASTALVVGWAATASGRHEATRSADSSGADGVLAASPAHLPDRSSIGAPSERATGFFAPPTALVDDATFVQDQPYEFHEFFFTRAIYSSGGRGFGWGRRGGSWAVDFPKADRQFIAVLRRLANLDAYEWENAVRLDDPAVRNFPFLYALEVGRMRMSEDEVRGLRDYLAAGGFLIIDDFWGPWDWNNFQTEMERVLPGYPIVELPLTHPLFNTFYEIDEILVVPNIRNGRTGNPAYYTESGGEPRVLGIFEDDGAPCAVGAEASCRLMMVINFDTDLGDAWEWMEDPYYPLDRSTFAYEMGVNMIVYAMSH